MPEQRATLGYAPETLDAISTQIAADETLRRRFVSDPSACFSAEAAEAGGEPEWWVAGEQHPDVDVDLVAPPYVVEDVQLYIEPVVIAYIIPTGCERSDEQAGSSAEYL